MGTDKEIEPSGFSTYLFERHPVPMWVYDLETLAFLAVNRAATKKYGYTKKEFLDLTIKDIRPPEDIGKLVADAAAPRPDLQYSGIWHHQLKDGRIIWVEIISHKLDYQGRPAALVMALDVTAQEQAKAALRASEERYRQLVEQAPVMMAVVRDRRLAYINSTGVAIFGAETPYDLLGRSFLSLLHPDSLQDVVAYVAGLATGQPGPLVVNKALRLDGRVIFLEGTTTLTTFEGRLAYQIISYDVTEREQYQAALRANETRFEALIENSADAIALLDVEGRLVYDSPAAPGMLGYEPEDFLEQSFFELVHPDDLNDVQESFAGLRASPRSQVQQVFRLRHKQGEWLWIEAVARNLLDEPGVGAIVVNYRDVTVRIKAEAALRESEKRFNSAFEDAAIGMALVALDGRWLEVNRALCAIVGYAREDLLAMTFQDITHPEDLGADLAFVRQMVTGEIATYQMEKRYVHRNGEIIWVLLSVSLVRDSQDQPAYFISQIQDISDRKRAEEELRQHLANFKALSRVAAFVSSTLDLDALLGLVLETIGIVIPHDAASIILIQEGVLRVARHTGYIERGLEEYIHRIAVPLEGHRLYGQMIASGVPMLIPDSHKDPLWQVWPGGEWIRSYLGVPITRNGQVIGFLNLDGAQIGQFSVQHAEVLQAFSSHIGAALSNAALFATIQESVEQREKFSRLMQDVLLNSQSLPDLYRALYRAARELMPCELFVLAIRDEKNPRRGSIYAVDRGEELPAAIVPLEAGLSAHVIESGRAVLERDMQDEPPTAWVHFSGEGSVRSVVAAPLIVGGRVFGMLAVHSYAPGAYDEQDLHLVHLLAGQASALIQNTRLLDEIRQQLKHLDALRIVSTAVRAAQSLEAALPLILDETLKALDTDVGGILVYDPNEKMFTAAAARGWYSFLEERPRPPGTGIAGTVFATGEMYLSDEFATDPLTPQDARNQMPPGWGGACLPIRSGGEVLAVMLVAVPVERPLDPQSLNLLAALAEMAGATLHRMRLFEETTSRLEQLRAMQAVDVAILSSLDLRLTLNILIKQVTTQLAVDAASVLLLNTGLGVLEVVAHSGLRHFDSMFSVRLGEGWAGRIALDRQAQSHQSGPQPEENPRLAALWRAEGFAAYYGLPLVARGQVLGVLELFHRRPLPLDREWLSFLEGLSGQAAIAIDNAQLFQDLQQSNQQLAIAYDATIEGWSRALDLRDKETEGHSLRVTDLTLRLAHEMGMDPKSLTHIRRGALLHDIGKMGIPDAILLKPGPLTEEEWVIMRRHPDFAYEMLAPIRYLQSALDIPYCHHEKWDGTGYPRGLRGEAIPLAARIFAVVDVWDALTSERAYRPAWSRELALAHIGDQSGRHFDPQVVEVFLKLIEVPTHARS
ncbi:MAG: PAS domain S-box protein [Anaerolineae bacterium]|nr:MAG: PAS domain S-box protein [Anaerolineae bacterium]